MPFVLSDKLKEILCEYYRDGHSVSYLVTFFAVSKSTVYKVLKERKVKLHRKPKHKCWHCKKIKRSDYTTYCSSACRENAARKRIFGYRRFYVLKQKGYTWVKIGSMHGLSKSQVYNSARAYAKKTGAVWPIRSK